MVASKPVTVSLPAVMRKYMHMSDHAINCAFGHGQVYLDGRCLGNGERVMDYEPVRGHMLECVGRQVRLGSRPAGPPQASLFG